MPDLVIPGQGPLILPVIPNWQDFTTVWSSSSPPAIGNGSITGKYIRIGDLVIFQGRIEAGSTTTFGSGQYSCTLPLPRDNTVSNQAIGNGWVRNVSPAADYHFFCYSTNTTTFVFRGLIEGASSLWDFDSPFTLADGDWATWTLMYETTAA